MDLTTAKYLWYGNPFAGQWARLVQHHMESRGGWRPWYPPWAPVKFLVEDTDLLDCGMTEQEMLTADAFRILPYEAKEVVAGAETVARKMQEYFPPPPDFTLLNLCAHEVEFVYAGEVLRTFLPRAVMDSLLLANAVLKEQLPLLHAPKLSDFKDSRTDAWLVQLEEKLYEEPGARGI